MGRGYGGDEAFTTVTATGTVEGSWATVGFSMTVHGTAKTGPAAKKAVQPSAAKIEAGISVLRDQGVEIEVADIRATYSVDKAVEYDGRNQKFAGYTCTYTCSFKSKTVEMASAIHDKLTSLGEDVECDSPTFAIAEEAALREAALTAAWEKVQLQIKQLCAACKIDPDGLTVTAINPGDHGGGPFRAHALAAGLESAPSAPIQLSAGRPQVSVTLTVSFEN